MRAKSTTNGVSEDQGKPTKGAALQSKKSTANVAGLRKRGVLGDVSNVGKADAPEGKKAAPGKAGLASKAAGPTGVQKNTTRTASRTTLAAKETKKVETKKSGSGTIGTVQKRKVSSTSQSVKDEPVSNDEAEPLRKKVHTMEAEKENARSAAVVEPAVDEDKAARKALMEKVAIIDSADMDDPHMVPEYADDIFEYLRNIEPLSIPNSEYMNHQDNLEWKTRGILVDWLIEVHTRFHLLTETLFLTVNIIDRFLSEKVVQLDRLQLVGITAMFIASKYEEVLSPHVENFVTIADNGFSQDEILSAERAVLSTLNYDLSYPNPINFLRRISKADDYDIQCRTMGKYLMEISLLDHRLMEYAPSQVAAGAMYLSRLMLDRGEWVRCAHDLSHAI